MRPLSSIRLFTALSLALLFGLAPSARLTLPTHAQGPTLSPNATVFATGLNNPRGLRFGPDGNLYVAEGGLGGTLSTAGLTQSSYGSCAQVPAAPGPGPDTGGYTARISRIAANGTRTTVVDNLPSSQTSPATGSSVSGVSDVEFVHGVLYALLGGAGCSHGIRDVPNGILQIAPDGTWSEFNLSAYVRSHPPANPGPNTDDYEPDGSWYSMVQVNGDLYALEPNNQQMVKLSLNSAQITQVADFSTLSATTWVGPTSIAFCGGSFYVGNLGEFPITPGTEKVFKVAPNGTISTVASGLTTVLGLACDKSGNLYALESMGAPGFPGPSQIGTGMVVKVNFDGTTTTVTTGLSFPTAMTFGPDGNLYVSNFGLGAPGGAGQIVKITLGG